MPRTATSAAYARWIGDRLRKLRREAGLTQAEVARRLGARQPYIAAVEAGRSNLTLAQLVEIATATGAVMDITFRIPVRAQELLDASRADEPSSDPPARRVSPTRPLTRAPSTEAFERQIPPPAGLRAIQAWETEHGALSPESLAQADGLLDAAGIPCP